MIHKEEFYIKKYDELKQYADDKGLDFPYNNLDEFISDYSDVAQSTSNVLSTMKYNLQFETSYKTALAEYRALKEIGEYEKLRDLKSMSTRDFADMYKDEIMDFYKVGRHSGLTPSMAKNIIARYWFGSE